MSCEEQIDKLASCSTEQLREQWTQLYGLAPLPRISKELLMRGIAYRLQENEYGGLSPQTLQRIAKLGKEFQKSGQIAPASVRAGTRLIREWKGKTHEVEVLKDGYAWSGKRYRSLSEIARAITGTRWSGPRFFGTEIRNE